MPRSVTSTFPFWSETTDHVLLKLQTTIHGLDSKEADQRLEKYGKNRINGRQRVGALTIILSQIKSPLIIILFVGSAVSIVVQEWTNAIVILATIIVNTALGFWQENKSETILEELKRYLKVRVRVRRNGVESEKDASLLVPGDIIHISQGDRVPADGRILHANNLEIDESILTGESLPVQKHGNKVKEDAVLGERTSMIWSGTLVVQGFADVVVTNTGKETEFGRIAELSTTREEEQTPLQKAVARLARIISIVVLTLSAFLFIIGLATGQDPIEMFFIAIAIAVSAVPEGLPVALTVILAIGVERLAKQKGIVRKLLAAETLGSTSLILTDKTGTLTEANMRLVEAIALGENNEEAQAVLLREAVLNTDTVIENPDENPDEWQIIGHGMELSLVRDAGIRGIRLPKLLQKYHVLDRVPFDSKKKYSITLVTDGSQQRAIFMGAPEILLGFTNLSQHERENIEQEIEKRAYEGDRLLAVASLAYSADKLVLNTPYKDLEFKGYLAFRDPIRPNIKEAIKRIAKAGVKTVIVTGDHKGTAEHVARELGILKNGGLVITGSELDQMSESTLRTLLPKIRIYARVTPEQKLMLTQLYRERGEVVAVTGDGVNDAPALKAADVGIAVGSGTEVAKGAADLVILDNNFNTIVLAIEEGRRILDNIRKAVTYLLSDAVDELALIGGALLFQVPIPITALQILFVNFFSDSFPAIALAFEEIRDSKQRSTARGAGVILTQEVRTLTFGLGIGASILLFSLYNFLLLQGYELSLVRSFIFAAFATNTLFVAFSFRGLRHGIITYNPFGNPYLTAGVCIGLVLTWAAIYTPFLQRVLDTVPLPLPWLGGVLLAGFTNIVLAEGIKWFYRNKEN